MSLVTYEMSASSKLVSRDVISYVTTCNKLLESERGEIVSKNVICIHRRKRGKCRVSNASILNV